jgi:hypothetical protein
MSVPTLTTILKRILKQPTAPFHEYHVRGEIEKLLKDCPNVKLKAHEPSVLGSGRTHGPSGLRQDAGQ